VLLSPFFTTRETQASRSSLGFECIEFAVKIHTSLSSLAMFLHVLDRLTILGGLLY
jgi:hypothetical protein